MTDEPTATFDLEIYVPRVTGDSAIRLVARLRELAVELSTPGRELQVLGATLALADEVCFVRFHGTRSALETVALRAEMPDARLTEVVVVSGDVA